MGTEDAASLPIEMLSFILRQGEFAKAGLRLGQLAVPGRPAISTPAFVAATSRGVIPHVTQDVQSKLTRVPAIYIGLEDCMCPSMPAWRKLTIYLQLMVSYRKIPESPHSPSGITSFLKTLRIYCAAQ